MEVGNLRPQIFRCVLLKGLFSESADIRYRQESKVTLITRASSAAETATSEQKRGGGTARPRYISMREKIAKARRYPARVVCSLARALPSVETNCAHTVCTVVGILPADMSIRSRTKKDEDRSELSSWLDTSGSGAERPGSSSSFRSKVRQGSQIVSTSSLSRGIAGARSFVEVRDLFRNKSEEGDAPA